MADKDLDMSPWQEHERLLTHIASEFLFVKESLRILHLLSGVILVSEVLRWIFL